MAVKGEGEARPVASGPGGVNVADSANEPVVRTKVAGDAFDRYVLTADGTAYVGDGTDEPSAQSATSASPVGTKFPFWSPIRQTLSNVNWNSPKTVSNIPSGIMDPDTSALNNQVIMENYLSAGTWTLRVAYYRASDRGVAEIAISTNAGTNWTVIHAGLDAYNATVVNRTFADITGIVIAEGGTVQIRIKIISKHASSSGYYFGLEDIEAVKTGN